LRRQYSDFAQSIGVELECDIRFHGEHVFTCSTILRATAEVNQALNRFPDLA
jgi:hypothetical protein